MLFVFHVISFYDLLFTIYLSLNQKTTQKDNYLIPFTKYPEDIYHLLNFHSCTNKNQARFFRC